MIYGLELKLKKAREMYKISLNKLKAAESKRGKYKDQDKINELRKISNQINLGMGNLRVKIKETRNKK